jgi:hypothetical protein
VAIESFPKDNDWLLDAMIHQMLEDVLTFDCGNDGLIDQNQMLSINSQAMKFIDSEISFDEYLDAVRDVYTDPYQVIVI